MSSFVKKDAPGGVADTLEPTTFRLLMVISYETDALPTELQGRRLMPTSEKAHYYSQIVW